MVARALDALAATLVALALSFAFCTPAEGVAIVGGIDTLDTACKDVGSQPEPAYVYFACDVIDATGQAVHSFAVKVPPASAPTFRSKMVRAPRLLAPAK